MADALAIRGMVDQQVAAQESLVQAVLEAYRLSDARYTKGIDSYLVPVAERPKVLQASCLHGPFGKLEACRTSSSSGRTAFRNRIYLGVLDAQRSLYAAQQGLVALRLIRVAKQVRLYAVLGGCWQAMPPGVGE